MAIFKITQLQQTTPSSDEKQSTQSEETPFDGNEREVNNVISAPPASGDQASFTLTGVVEKEDPKYLIQVTGAASHIFTEALNRVLAIENMATVTLPAYVEHQTQEQKRLYPKHRLVKVHVMDGADIKIEDLIEVQNDVLKNAGESDYLVAVESADYSKVKNINRYTSVNALSKLERVSVTYGCQKAVATLLSMIRR